MRKHHHRLPALIFQTWLLALAVATAPSATADAPIKPNTALHPLAGSWRWTVFGSPCVETFLYRINNTMLATSGESTSEWNYTITPQASEEGFYTLVETAMRHNGKKDCSGDTVDDRATVSTRFIQFSPAHDRMLVCKQASLAACFGPFKRLPPEEVSPRN